ncbi:MAG TPA: hypothetical protein PKH98_03860, partial [Candidatus Omnitrophota bacterium]|nr:hypothetical protein [Candidatus Omnitrophota bacterium]
MKKRIEKTFIVIVMALMSFMTISFSQNVEKNVFVYDDHNKRDPFWSLVSEDGIIINYDDDLILSDLRLEGVIVDDAGNNLAIINGQILKNQDRIGQFLIMRIERDHVVFEKNGQPFTL